MGQCKMTYKTTCNCDKRIDEMLCPHCKACYICMCGMYYKPFDYPLPLNDFMLCGHVAENICCIQCGYCEVCDELHTDTWLFTYLAKLQQHNQCFTNPWILITKIRDILTHILYVADVGASTHTSIAIDLRCCIAMLVWHLDNHVHKVEYIVESLHEAIVILYSQHTKSVNAPIRMVCTSMIAEINEVLLTRSYDDNN